MVTNATIGGNMAQTGTESTLNNKAKWQSLRNQGEGNREKRWEGRKTSKGRDAKRAEVKKYREYNKIVFRK